MHTTPPAPVDLDVTFPQLRGLARISTRLHPRRGRPSVEQSSVGGPLLWPADEPWPTCDDARRQEHPAGVAVPLVPVLQVFAEDVPELPFRDGSDLLQVTIASWEFSRGDERRWIPLEDRPAMLGWDFDSPDDHPWRALQNPAGLMLGDAGGIYLFTCTSCPARPHHHRFDCA